MIDELNHLDLFAGIGGFSLALQNVYNGKIRTSFSETDKYATKVFKKHFPEAKELGDIRTIRGKDIGHQHLVTFGFPCQDISIAGRRVGIEGGKRSSLFFEAIRIIDENRPEYFIAENVKGFFSSNEGEDLLVALESITNIGYDCQWQLLNTKWFLPQNRERVFIVGHLREGNRPQIFPIGESIEDSSNARELRNTKDDTAGCINCKNNSPQYQFDSSTTLIIDRKGKPKNKNIASTLTATEKSGGNHSDMDLIQVGVIGKDSEATRVYDISGISRTIKNGGGMGAKTGLYIVGYTRDKNGKRTNHIKKEAGTIKSVTGSNSNQSEFILISDSGKKRKKEIKETVPPLRANNGASSNNFIANDFQIRRLTPTECERLQGFPDGYTEGISDTQRYKCLGNAISIPPVEEIYRRLYGNK